MKKKSKQHKPVVSQIQENFAKAAEMYIASNGYKKMISVLQKFGAFKK